MNLKKLLEVMIRSLAAIFVGMALISFIAEGVEFLLVAMVNGSPTTDPESYFETRNRPAMLAAKFVYNTLAALSGGYVTAWVAGRRPVHLGIILALLQTAGLIYGMTGSPFADTTPMWVWVVLCVTMPPTIMIGVMIQTFGRPNLPRFQRKH